MGTYPSTDGDVPFLYYLLHHYSPSYCFFCRYNMRRSLIYLLLMISFIFYERYCSYAQDINKEVVNFEVEVVRSEDHTHYDLIIMVDIDEGWFVFSKASVNPPFQPLQIMIHLPEGHEKSGDTEFHGVQARNIAPGLAVYEGFFIFTQRVRINEILEPQNIECEIVYQAGDLYSFQPVQLHLFSLSLSVNWP